MFNGISSLLNDNTRVEGHNLQVRNLSEKPSIESKIGLKSINPPKSK